MSALSSRQLSRGAAAGLVLLLAASETPSVAQTAARPAIIQVGVADQRGQVLAALGAERQRHQRRRRIAVRVVDLHVFLTQGVARRHPRVQRQRERHADVPANRHRLIGRVFGQVVAVRVEVDARAEVAAQEARLREAEVDLLAERTDRDPRAQALAAAAEVPLGDAEVEDQLVDRRVAGGMGAAASLAWFTAYALQGAAPVRTLGMVEVVFSYIVSRRVLSESLSRQEKIGMALMVLGLVLICLQG